MAAHTPDLARFDALAERMPTIAQAVDCFADPTLRERAYYELVGILNPDTDDSEASPLTQILMAETQPGETVEQVMTRLVNELHRLRAQAVDRQAAEGWVAEEAQPSSPAGAVDDYRERTGL